MKKLTILIFLPVLLVSLSCKKKETNHPFKPVSKGDFLILVVSDSLECAMEYRKNPYSLSGMKESPVDIMAYFNSSTQNYDAHIEVYGVSIYGEYSIIIPGPLNVVDFPKFLEYDPDTFIDSIPGNQLKKNSVYNVPLDTSKIDFLIAPYYEDKVEAAWDKIKNLRIMFEYRKKFPDSKVGFLHVVRQNGEEKSYFFMNKYKP